jgi:hypothetical protein
MSTRARQFADQVSNLITISSGGSDFITPEILSASVTAASAAAAGYTDSELQNIDLTSTIITASSAAVSELDNRIFISSASPTLGNNDGRLWVDTTSASAPVLQTYGSGEFRKTIVNRTKALGGNITQFGPYTIHTFLGSSTFSALESLNVEYLVIAGGGGGGASWRGGGGGAGGYREGLLNLSAENYSIQVGAGAPSRSGSPQVGGNGVNSIFSTITASGGGGGGIYDAIPGVAGGSGGGGGSPSASGGTGTSNQGNNGGAGGSNSRGGGGGGAGSAGISGQGTSLPAGNGGLGLSSNITGDSIFRAGGGSGGAYDGGPQTVAVHGGGTGGWAPTSTFASSMIGGNGTINTGGGGGGASGQSDGTGGAGGSGIVIIRYLT